MQNVNGIYFRKACEILGLPARLGDLDDLAYKLYLEDASATIKNNEELKQV